jgi:hypothetical protein
MRNPCSIRCNAVICLFGCACAEAAELSRPAQPLCEDRPEVRDIGPPAGCGDRTGSHPRFLRVASLASSTLSSGLLTVPLGAVSVYDADEPATSVDQRCQPTTTTLCSSSTGAQAMVR